MSAPQRRRPLILICNDDGIDAPGIRALAGAMTHLGEVHVVAPLTEQSAVGHAITMREPLRLREWPFEAVGAASGEGVASAHAVSGTPADCIKMAVHRLLPRRPDLVCSGINNGPNTAVNVIYSGTVSAATEAAILGVDSVAFSLAAWGQTDFSSAAAWSAKVARQVLRRGLRPGMLLNVNLPHLPQSEVRGIRVTRQARSQWKETFDPRTDPYNQPYYWLGGEFVNLDDGPDTDLRAIEEGYVSLTPIEFDLTAYAHLDEMRTWTYDDAPADAAQTETPAA